MRARVDAVRAVLARLETLINRGTLPADLAGALRSRHEDRLRRLERHGESDGADDVVKRSGDWERQLIEAEREPGAVTAGLRVGSGCELNLKLEMAPDLIRGDRPGVAKTWGGSLAWPWLIGLTDV